MVLDVLVLSLRLFLNVKGATKPENQMSIFKSPLMSYFTRKQNKKYCLDGAKASLIAGLCLKSAKSLSLDEA